VKGEPDIALVTAGVKQVKDSDSQMVISFGGGSAIDAGKAIAALATNPGDVLDYLEVIGKGQKIVNPPLPFIAIPTTAGTGAEVTRNAVLSSPEHKLKVSLRSPLMLPRVALVDPELTYSMPKDIAGYTGMDALTQVIEPFVSNAANPLTDAFCREGIEHGARSIRYVHDSYDHLSRHYMALTSLLGGLALANAKLGAVHGFAGVLGGMYGAPHGALCAALLPHVMEVNIRALLTRNDTSGFLLMRYTQISHTLAGRDREHSRDAALRGVEWIRETVNLLEIPPLRSYGVKS
jgi:alcohol dehydrogenase class IV